MASNFQHQDLRGRSFRGQDLTGADFSGSDLRGANFAHTTLTRSNFSHVTAGLRRSRLLTLSTFLILLSLLSGALIAYISTGFGIPPFDVDFLITRSLAFAVLVALIALAMYFGEASVLLIFLVIAPAIVTVVAATPGDKPLIFALEFAIFNTAIPTLPGIIIGAITVTTSRIIAGRVGILLAGILAIAGTLYGLQAGFENAFIEENLQGLSVVQAKLIAFGITVPLVAGLIVFTLYIGSSAIADRTKYPLIRGVAIFLSTLGGTSFCGANLTDTNFTAAKLKGADFRRAILTRTNWSQTQQLQQARIGGTYLENFWVRQLVITKQGQDKNFDHLDLRGINLQGANLANASFIGAKLSEANLSNADLSGAKLVQAQLYGADLSGACLTGAIIQDWSISSDTKFEGVKCEYIYMQLPTNADRDPCRKPDNRNEVFKDGDFADFIAPIIKTMDLYRTQDVDLRSVAQTFKSIDLFHHKGIDPTAAAIALKQLAEQHPEAGLEVVALEGRGEEKVRVQARVTGKADRSALSAEYFQRYEQISSLPYADIQSLLTGIAEKDDRIRSLEKMVNNAIGNEKFYVETYYHMGDSVSEKSSSINISAGGNIGDVSGIAGGDISGVINLGTISGSVTNAINQIPDIPEESDQPSLKELLLQLQAAIEAEAALSLEDKAEALEQVKILAEAGQAPEDGALKKAAKTAVKVLKGTVATLPDVTQLVEATTKLLPTIVALLAIM